MISNEEDARNCVRRYIDRHPDAEFRRAVYALQLLYHPEHLALLLGMALRGHY